MSEIIQMAHGSGGKMSADLVRDIILPAFANSVLSDLHDSAILPTNGTKMAFSTDSFVVQPRFFPGGDIGKLAVCGTVNDVAMSGAVPYYLSAGFILEEGFRIDELKKIVESMSRAAREAGVNIVAGDTKVVEKGSADGIYINTAGIGFIPDGIEISAARIKEGQNIILSGTLGDHSVAVMSSRHGLTLPPNVVSDCAPLNKLVADILAVAPQTPFLRDPTRGGLATALNEIAAQAGVGIMLSEDCLPIAPEVQAVCDILGFDPLYLANEGKLVAIVDDKDTAAVLAAMHANPYGHKACVIGRITGARQAQVGIETVIGGVRLLDMLIGEQLPRIC